MSFPTFLLNEGGDHVRPFVIIPVPDGSVWLKQHIAYFRTSGQSNEGFQEYANTWLPIFGYGNVPVIGSSPTSTKEKIIKLSDYAGFYDKEYRDTHPKQRVPPITALDNQQLIKNFLIWCYINVNNFDPEIMNTFMTRVLKPNNTLDNYKAIDYYKIHKFLDSYFMKEWQIRISLAIGGGIWDTTDFDFRLFKMYLTNTLPANIPMPIILPESVSEHTIEMYKKTLDATTGFNQTSLDALKLFLNDNNAQLSDSDILTTIQYSCGLIQNIWSEIALSDAYKITFTNGLKKYFEKTHPKTGGSFNNINNSFSEKTYIKKYKKTNKKRNKKRNKKTNKKRNKKLSNKRK